MRKALALSGMLFLLGNTAIIAYIVVAASLSPEKAVIVTVNRYGEMYADMAALALTIGAGFFSLYHVLKSPPS